MSAKIYVGNLSYSVDDAQLTELFSQFGTVKSAKVIKDRETGRAKGFAFVEMSSADEAQEAISELDGKESFGRNLKVNEAKDDDRPKRSFNGPKRNFSERR
ncbi:hypothetical protein M899_0878 [Bacteriovorax sp. BSW11_IV]|uniref:RNA recognition motif domain-containing protein n=1 Tax=Bacteriovorax sp. BSW11_IV TaxID=1353529 RepID=UPI000389FEB0|nr:RNA-binding protein [Bacteriovorax sp. BSW11_IV]EQC42997.1 hypothetical protein M899_0878 [Bacteriovorax sp. BSW11_IV]